MRRLVLGVTVVLVFAARAAEGGCCRVVRIDPQTPVPAVRVCEPDAAGGCSTVLFEGTIDVGEARNLCTTAATIVYYDFDVTTGGYGPRTEARCDGGDVEL